MVIDQVDFHIEDNDIKFTCTYELAHLPKPPESYLIRCVDFIPCLTFSNHTYSESSQNTCSIVILHVSIALIYADFELKNQMLQLGFDTL